MGTRSLTHIVEDSETLTTIYRQYDGYLSGHGLDLASFLADKKIVNGLSGDTKNLANGMGCLSAQIIAHFKKCAGNIYLYPPNSKDCWEDFTYFIYYKEKQIKIKVKNYSNAVIFDGTPTELLKKVKNES